MKDMIFDLRGLDTDESEWEDHPARIQLENMLLDNKGKIIRVRVMQVRPHKIKPKEPMVFGGWHFCEGTKEKPHETIIVKNGERCKICEQG